VREQEMHVQGGETRVRHLSEAAVSRGPRATFARPGLSGANPPSSYAPPLASAPSVMSSVSATNPMFDICNSVERIA
jgi:hypothetical protein